MWRTAGAWLLGIGALLFSVGCTERQGSPGLLDATITFPDGGASDARADAGCRVDTDCGDRFACTIDHCTAGVCSHVACTDCCGAGRACDPMSGCGPMPQPCTADADCMDAQPCTLDACRSHVCQHTPMDALCSAGHICIAAIGCTPRPPDHCAVNADCASIGFCYGHWNCETEFGCVFVGPTDCDDAVACTVDTCSTTMNMCVHTAAGGACTSSCGSMGTSTCHPDGTTSCAPPAEVCSGHDDDCDGMIDEGFACVMSTPGSCTTTCASTGTSMCDATCHAGACMPPAEICNGRDDDCDTTIDEGCCTVRACTTSCGSAGMTSCNPDGTAGPCAAPEICNGRDDDCDTTVDEGFGCAVGVSSACTSSCATAGTSTCDATCHAGMCVPPVETCNGRDDDCDTTIDEGFSCVMGTMMSCPTTCGSTGTRMCNGVCVYDACVPPAEICNGVDDNCNGVVDEGFTCAAGSPRACTALGMGFVSGTAFCRGNCSGYDPSTCSRCGDGVRQAPEACDMGDLGGATCTSVAGGFNGGTLACFPSCTYNTSACTRCGDGVINGPEQCDGTQFGTHTCTTEGFTGGGALMCSAACALNTSACIWSPTGTWSVAPGVNYYCAFGAVSISFGNLMFNDTGSSLTVSGGGINCMMTGASARVTRMFDVTCTLTGGCNETYRLTGTFTGNNTWTGTFRASFSGSQCGVASCSNQIFSGITGTR